MPNSEAMIQECTKCEVNFASYHIQDLCNSCESKELREKFMNSSEDIKIKEAIHKLKKSITDD